MGLRGQVTARGTDSGGRPSLHHGCGAGEALLSGSTASLPLPLPVRKLRKAVLGGPG